jgi:hypothetical protein
VFSPATTLTRLPLAGVVAAVVQAQSGAAAAIRTTATLTAGTPDLVRHTSPGYETENRCQIQY